MAEDENFELQMKRLNLMRALEDEFIQACRHEKMPIEALECLVSQSGRITIGRMVKQIVQDWNVQLSPGMFAKIIQGGVFRTAQPVDTAPPKNVIRVPDLGAGELFDQLRRGNTSLVTVQDWNQWDFYRKANDGSRVSGRGRAYAFLEWCPKPADRSQLDRISPQDIRAYFSERGYYGHVGAFITLLCDRFNIAKGRGRYVTIPEESDCKDGHYFPVMTEYRCNLDVQGISYDHDTFVAFREVPAP